MGETARFFEGELRDERGGRSRIPAAARMASNPLYNLRQQSIQRIMTAEHTILKMYRGVTVSINKENAQVAPYSADSAKKDAYQTLLAWARAGGL